MAYFFILLGALLRVIPHPANFTPIGAIALFGGAHLGRKQALLLPLAAMLVSDVFIGFDSLSSRMAVYGSFVAAGLIGMWMKGRTNAFSVVGASLASSLLFFLVTNLPFLYPASMYSHDWAGAVASYTNAIPFFRNTLAGDLVYATVFFGGYELVKRYVARRSSQQAANRIA